MKPLLADDAPYFKSGTSSPDTWIDKAVVEIQRAGGVVSRRAFMEENSKAAFLIEFVGGGDTFQMVWEVLTPKHEKDMLAAKRQAATMLYHDVKNCCIKLRVRGWRRAFSEYLLLPEGVTVGDSTSGDLARLPPSLRLLRSDAPLQIPEVMEGEYS